ncbi:threonine-phosphate decarboxylase [Rhodopseudomonas palustris]|uniref:threonine-phosphate decarboxylase n=1 Tax=Rhodopseudomonas palustris TaxID=1076 RepID=A0A323UUN4_RHOPL|nr:threonine-phosphate decarboxylase CobD [Rhodopseudomonas palustris]PZA11308.1 threonine-phosphate decarboxylase [Rhodopseudomonas palustris]
MKHGGDLTAAMVRHGGDAADWLDLSTGINPRPWPIPEIAADAWQRLPSQADETALYDAARFAYEVPEEAGIVAAAGTQALIQWLPHLAAPGGVAIIGPTYAEHALAWRNAGRELVGIASLDDIPEQARHAVVVNPNNPDGRVVEIDTLRRAAAQLRRRGGWLVIDEAFADVDPSFSAASLTPELPIVVLRSFGKFYGLAGVRLGFAIAGETIARRISLALGPWSCSGPALRIGAAALRDQAWAIETRDELREQAMRLDEVLSGAGLDIVGGTPLFRLARHPGAHRLHESLAKQRIWCRRFDWADDLLRFGLPADTAGFDRLAAALAAPL